MPMQMSTGSIAITQLNPAQLVPNPKNARIHSERQIKQIAKSISTFGFNTPILIDCNQNVIAGHGRLLAAKSLKLVQVPTIRLEHLTAQQVKAFAIADNKLTDSSTWNDRLLGEIFIELSSQDLDFSLEASGFTMGEIDLCIENLAPGKHSSNDAEKVPLPEPGPAITQLGDLWLLDKHRIYCGDALVEASFSTMMKGDLASLIFTDPPYNVPILGHVSGKGGSQHREFAMAVGEMSEDQFTDFLKQVFINLTKNSGNGSIHYICMDWRHLYETITASKSIYSELKNICVWVKDKGGMGSLYRSQHEMVLVFKHGKSSHRNNVELGRYGRYRTNVWNQPSASTLSRQGAEGDVLAMHPTVKPIGLIADAILDCSARGDIVLDTFLGSGSTLLASERVGRICYGMELDPLYVDLAIRRWQQMTGESAIHAVTGVAFDAMVQQSE